MKLTHGSKCLELQLFNVIKHSAKLNGESCAYSVSRCRSIEVLFDKRDSLRRFPFEGIFIARAAKSVGSAVPNALAGANRNANMESDFACSLQLYEQFI